MRRLLSCVLMITLLTACAAGGEDPEVAAGVVQDTYRAMEGCTATVGLTAEIGTKVYTFTLEADCRREGDTVLTVTAPELLAGITARVRPQETVLEYDGAGLSLGNLDGQGLTPLNAVPAILYEAAKGYTADCVWADPDRTQLTVTTRDPAAAAGAGTEYRMRFRRSDCALLQAEISAGGVQVLTADFQNFTFTQAEVDHNGNGDHADLG